MSKMPTRVSASGTTETGAQFKALILAIIDALNSGGYQSGNRTTVTTTSTLTITQSGLVLVDCTSGNVVLTLPASGATTDDAVYLIRRIDSTANALTVIPSGTDTIEGVATAQSIVIGGVLQLQIPAGSNNWRVIFGSAATVVSVNGGQLAGLRSRIINGAMNVDQRNAGAAITVTTQVAALDRFGVSNITGGGTLTVQQSTMTGFGKSLKATATAAMTALTATSYVRSHYQVIEAQNCFDLNSKTITLSFKAETNWTGNLAVAFNNSSGTRSYIANVAVVSGINTCSVTVLLESTTIAANSNGVGVTFDIGFCNEATYQNATTGSWIAGAYSTSTTSTQWCKTTGNFLNVTQVQLEQGAIATAFEQRPIGLELALCQRYYERLGGLNQFDIICNTYQAAAANFDLQTFYKVTKRTLPTLTKVGAWTVVNCNQPTPRAGNLQGTSLFATATALGTTAFYTVDATTYVDVNAEYF